MLRVFSKVDKLYWLLAPVMLYQTCPWLSYRIRPIVPTCLVCIWFLFSRMRFARKSLSVRLDHNFEFVCLAWIFITFINSIYFMFNHGDLTKYYIIASGLSSFSIFVIYYFSFQMGKINEIVFLTFVALIGIALTLIASVKASNIEGLEAARILTTNLEKHGSMRNYQMAADARIIGAAGYGQSYAFALLIPSIVWAIFKSRTWTCRILFAVVLVSLVASIRVGGLGTVVFVAVFGVILFLGSKIGMKTRLIYCLGFTSVVGLLLFAYYPTMFSWLSSPIQFLGLFFPADGSIGQRITSVVEAINGDFGTYAIGRYQLQVRSLDVFFQNPIFGVGLYYFPHRIYDQIGGHSQLLDLMAQAGIPGFFFYSLFLYSLNKFYLSLDKLLQLGNGWRILVAIYLCSYVLLSVANPISALPSTLYIIPGIALMVRMIGVGHAR